MRRRLNHNESGVYNSRIGLWGWKAALFTHKDVNNGTVFLERFIGAHEKDDVPDNPWIREKEVVWMEE